MIKQLIQFEHKIEDFIGRFILEPHTPTPIAKEMLLQFLRAVGEIEERGKAALEAQAAQNKEEVIAEPTQDHCVNCE